jgi:CheY-like chemotaxis protein
MMMHEPLLDTAASPAIPPVDLLIVEDDVELAEIFSFMGTSLGLTEHVIHDGAQAIAWLQTHTPTLIMLDVNLPTCTGLEVARWIDAQPHLNHAVVLFVTANPHAVNAYGDLVDFTLVKPVSFEQTRTLLQRLMAARTGEAPPGTGPLAEPPRPAGG